MLRHFAWGSCIQRLGRQCAGLPQRYAPACAPCMQSARELSWARARAAVAHDKTAYESFDSTEAAAPEDAPPSQSPSKPRRRTATKRAPRTQAAPEPGNDAKQVPAPGPKQQQQQQQQHGAFVEVARDMGLSDQQIAASFHISAWALVASHPAPTTPNCAPAAAAAAASIAAAAGSSAEKGGTASAVARLAEGQLLSQRLVEYEGLLAPARLDTAVLQLLLRSELACKDAGRRGIVALALSGPYLPSHLDLMQQALEAFQSSPHLNPQASFRLGPAGITTIFTAHELPSPGCDIPATKSSKDAAAAAAADSTAARAAGAGMPAASGAEGEAWALAAPHLAAAITAMYGPPLPASALSKGKAAEVALGLRVFAWHSWEAWQTLLSKVGQSKRPPRDVIALRLDGFLSAQECRELQARAERLGLLTAVVPGSEAMRLVRGAGAPPLLGAAAEGGQAAALGAASEIQDGVAAITEGIPGSGRRRGRPRKVDGSAGGSSNGASGSSGGAGGGTGSSSGGSFSSSSSSRGEATGVLVICRPPLDPNTAILRPDDFVDHPGFEKAPRPSQQQQQQQPPSLPPLPPLPEPQQQKQQKQRRRSSKQQAKLPPVLLPEGFSRPHGAQAAAASYRQQEGNAGSDTQQQPQQGQRTVGRRRRLFSSDEDEEPPPSRGG